MTDKPKKENFLLPKITDLKSAQSAARQGTAVCIVIMIFSSVIVAISSATEGGKPSQEFIFMMIIYGLIAFLTYKMSRVAAILGLLIYLGDRLVLIASSGLKANYVVAIFFIFAFINSIRGTFAYHRLRRGRAEAIQKSNIP